MPTTRRALLTFTATAALGALASRAGRAQAPRTAPRVSVADTQIYLIRGLLGVFSTGMDELASQFRAQGYNQATLWMWDNVDGIVNDIVAGNQRGDTAHLVVIGHSLGANAVIQVADRLARQNIPVDLAVTFDFTEDFAIPGNIAHFVNIYQNNGFGRPAIKPPGFRGDFRNVNVSDQTQIDHVTIDNAPQLQAYVRDQVYKLTQNVVRTTGAKRKAKGG
jgi:hypothetical protein